MSVTKEPGAAHWRYDFQIKGFRYRGTLDDVPVDRPKAVAVEAEKRKRALAAKEVELRIQTGRGPMTIGEACDRWWDEVGQHLAEDDIEKHVHWLRDMLGPSLPLEAVTNDDIARLVAERRTHTKRSGTDEKGRPVYKRITGRTVNRTVTKLLKRIIRRARDAWDVPIAREPRWKLHMLPESGGNPRPLSLDQERKIAEIERVDYTAIRRFATVTGLRLREALLRWSVVDLQAGTIVARVKGGEERSMPLSAEARAILEGERDRHPEFVFTFIAQRTKIDFRTKKEYIRGQRYPITASGLTSQRRRNWSTAGVAARWHDLRHTAGSRTVQATGSLAAAQELLGHSDPSITAKFYAQYLPELRNAMEVTAERFAPLPVVRSEPATRPTKSPKKSPKSISNEPQAADKKK